MKSIKFYLSIFIVALISIPILGNLYRWPMNETVLKTENRTVTKWVGLKSFKKGEIRKFFQNFDLFIADRLLGKDHVVTKISQLTGDPDKFLNLSNIDKGIIGKNGFVFLGDSYEKVVTRHFLDAMDAEKNKKKFVEFHKEISELTKKIGANYFVLAAPDKHTIYCEEFSSVFAPYGCQKVTDVTNKKRSFLEEEKIVTVYPAYELQQNKADPVYYKTDTHWNARGAEIGFYALMKVVQEKGTVFKKKAFIPNKAYSLVKEKNTKFGDLGAIASLPESFPLDDVVFKLKTNQEISILWKNKEDGKFKNALLQDVFSGAAAPYEYLINKNAPNQLKLLILHDSFNTAMSQFLNLNFTEIRYSKRGRPIEELKEIIVKEKPDLVIYETVERGF